MTRQISTYTQQVVDALNAVHTPEQVREGGIEFWHHRFYAMSGVRFDRIVKQSQITSSEEAPTWSNEQRFVQCFVERDTGDIHYSAGWKAPAKWVDGPAVEWHADEAQRYAQFVKDGGWGYQGQREAWEAKNPVEETVETLPDSTIPTAFDIKKFAQGFLDALEAERRATNGPDFQFWGNRVRAFVFAWSAMTGTVGYANIEAECRAIVARTGYTAHTSDLT